MQEVQEVIPQEELTLHKRALVAPPPGGHHLGLQPSRRALLHQNTPRVRLQLERRLQLLGVVRERGVERRLGCLAQRALRGRGRRGGGESVCERGLGGERRVMEGRATG